MQNIKWLNLQLFAGEGAGDGGGEAAATGETNTNTGDADQRLRELGVPDAVLEKRAKRNASKPVPKAVARTAPEPSTEQTEEQAAAAENPTEEQKTDAPSRMSWEEIMADPEYNKQMQATIQARLRSAKGAEEALGKLTPALEVLARQYGLDMENIDYDALAQKINKDQTFYEDLALERGERVEKTMEDDQQDRDTKRQERFQQKTLQEQMFQQHIAKLEQQGEEMKKVFPNFDLMTELKNPAFARMTAPNVGISVEDAYYAVHRNEIQFASMQVAAQKTAQKISNSIQAGNRRPNENGTSGQAPSVTTFDYRNASPEQRAELKRQIRSAAARGQKLYPGR